MSLSYVICMYIVAISNYVKYVNYRVFVNDIYDGSKLESGKFHCLK